MGIKTWWNSMNTTEKINAIFRGITTAVVGGGTVFCIHEMRQSKKILNQAVANIGDNVDVEVSDELIHRAVEKATQDQIRRHVRTATNETLYGIREQTKTEVEKTVKESYGKITEAVSDRMAKEVEKINKNDILNEIKEKATEKLAEKLDDNLDSITDEYSKNLSNMGKVYEALAEKLQSKA